MSKLDDTIADVAYVLNIVDMAYILDALMAYRNIIQAGNCNDCKAQKECEVKPKLGQLVRYNCPFYHRDGQNETN